MVKTVTYDWYWACPRHEPAGDRFILANGQDEFWDRVRAEIDHDEECMWSPVHRGKEVPQLDDILDMMFTVVPTYGVNMNRFVFEAARIPVFARFLRNARHDLCNYVSNSLYPEHQPSSERYSNRHMEKLGRIVSATLGCRADWF